MIHRHSRKNFLIPILIFITTSTYFCKKESEELKSLKRDANIAYTKQDLNGALALFSQVLEMDSDSTNTMIMLGKIYYYKKDFEKAEEMFKNAASSGKCNSNAEYWLSKMQSLHGEDRAEVKERLESVIDNIPNRWEVQYTLGTLMESEGKIQEALSLYDQAQVESTKLSLLYLRLGKIYQKAQRKEMADRYFEKAKFISEENSNMSKMIESEINKAR